MERADFRVALGKLSALKGTRQVPGFLEKSVDCVQSAVLNEERTRPIAVRKPREVFRVAPIWPGDW
eukprot:scaffold7712_cov267-Pinguiococcus_pyrenoidosus.AAC.1